MTCWSYVLLEKTAHEDGSGRLRVSEKPEAENVPILRSSGISQGAKLAQEGFSQVLIKVMQEYNKHHGIGSLNFSYTFP